MGMKPSIGPSLDFLLRSGSSAASLAAAVGLGISAALSMPEIFDRGNGSGKVDRNLDIVEAARGCGLLASFGNRSWSELRPMQRLDIAQRRASLLLSNS